LSDLGWCEFCGGEGFAFAPLGGKPCRDIWIPCPVCAAGQGKALSPRSKAILEEHGGDPAVLVHPIPPNATALQARRMVEAIFRSFYRGTSASAK
jgi:hypothetical protein